MKDRGVDYPLSRRSVGSAMCGTIPAFCHSSFYCSIYSLSALSLSFYLRAHPTNCPSPALILCICRILHDNAPSRFDLAAQDIKVCGASGFRRLRQESVRRSPYTCHPPRPCPPKRPCITARNAATTH